MQLLLSLRNEARFTRPVFIAACVACALPWVSPPMALALGLAFGALFTHPHPVEAQRVSKTLLQASVVGLGFAMNLAEVLQAGRAGLLYTAIGIVFALGAGLLLGRLLGVRPVPAFLISTGTAICGGSAIAAVGPLAGATDDEMSVSLGTIFILNSVALLTFPALGSALNLTQSEFGLWSALAIHDTSSVVGAAARYGAVSLAIATTVKLTRALWIVPLSVGTALVRRVQARIQWPWFIGLFVLAAVLNSSLPSLSSVFRALAAAGRIGLTVTLFLIGTGLTPKKMKEVGPRPLIHGVLLWLIVGAGSLLAVRAGWIGF